MRLILLFSLFTLSQGARDLENKLAEPHVEYEFPNVTLIPKCVVKGKPLDLLIVFDVSGSLQDEFQNSVGVLRDVIDSVAISKEATRVALVTFSKHPYTHFHFNTYDNRFHILKSLDRLQPTNSLTHTGAALEYVLQEMSPAFGMRGPEVPKIIFLITDGRSHDNPKDWQNAQILREQYGYPIWAYGTGEYVAMEPLVNITGDPEMIVTKKTRDKLEFLFADWKGKEICEEVPVCIPGSSKPLDLLFIVDSSNSLEEGKSFRDQITFMHRVLNVVNVHPDAVKVALITYSSQVFLPFDFNKFKLNEDVHEFIDTRIQSHNGTTQTRDALHKAFGTFEPQYGIRNGVPKMAIVLSDGHSAKDPADIARRLVEEKDVIIVAVAVSPPKYVDDEGLLRITYQHPERVFDRANLDTFEDFMLQYVDFGCPGMNISGKDAKPVVVQPVSAKCVWNGMQITVHTEKPFYGVIHAWEHDNNEKCRVTGTGETVTSLSLVEGGCGVTKNIAPDRSGYIYNAIINVQFHEQVASYADEIKQLSCFYRSAVPVHMTDDYLGQLNEKETSCSYTLHQYAPTGCTALAADLGNVLYHKWSCGLETGSFTKFLVHDCVAEFDGETIKLLDDEGCEIDPVLLETPDYTNDEYVYRESRTFAFPETNSIQFKCLISTCDMDSVEKCKYMIPPPCDPLNRKKRAISERTKTGFLNTYAVQTRSLNVVDKHKTLKTGERVCLGV